eukprot:CAMPEP_0119416786 /NCGR_PEP_ID=MMETSP1335-20130426/14096_1 /TAXON_ID=259385 /ORGANISM="Chrysoculter rhomboideus, Strain RCC1486" /LENGTH=40 /DNA_ID= /DNA_START= /DNA_END= /DNA_ORIENTATION=
MPRDRSTRCSLDAPRNDASLPPAKAGANLKNTLYAAAKAS